MPRIDADNGEASAFHLVGIVDDTERSFLQGYITADILVALGHGLAALVLQGPASFIPSFSEIKESAGA
jgi:hypothetical protein